MTTASRRQEVGAWCLLAAFSVLYLGITWDGQWHLDVGPDAFYTAPHLLFYFGSAAIGLTSLTVVLLNTWRPESSRMVVTVFGTFRAPLAFLVAGLGAAGHLLFGATDLWWHTVYGFDIIESTPSHLGLTLALLVEAIGLVLAFVPLRDRRAGRWGLAFAATFGIVGFMSLESTVLTEGVVLGVDLAALKAGAATALLLGLVAGVTRRARWVTATGLAFLAVMAVVIAFTQPATRIYADAIGQPFRDDAVGLPALALSHLVTGIPVVALLAAGAMWLARRRAVPPNRAMALFGTLAATGVAVCVFLLGDPAAHPIPMSLAAAALGAVAGWVGWQSSGALRTFLPVKEIA